MSLEGERKIKALSLLADKALAQCNIAFVVWLLRDYLINLSSLLPMKVFHAYINHLLTTKFY